MGISGFNQEENFDSYKTKIPQISTSDALSTHSPFSLCQSTVLPEMHNPFCICWLWGFVCLFPDQSKLNCLESPS